MSKSHWKTVTLGEVAENSTAATKDPYGDGYTRYVIGKHIPTDSSKITTWNEVGDGEFGSRIRTMFRAGDIICTTRGPNLRVAVPDFDGLSAHTNFILRTKDTNLLLQKYLEYVITSDGFQNHLKLNFRGSTNLFVNWSDAAKYEFPLPPVDEQRRIADLLWAADDSVTEWQETISRLEKLLAAVREDVLCNKELPRQKLKTSVKSITAGKSVLGFGKPAAENEFGVLKVSAVGADGFVSDENKTLEDKEAFIQAFSVHANDLLITRANTRELVGRVCIVPKDYPNLMLSDKSLRLEVDEESGDKNFLLQVLRSREARSQIESTASGTGGAMKNISQVQIMNLVLPLPELKIQKELASKTIEVEKSLEQTRLHVQKSIELKKQLLSKSLSA